MKISNEQPISGETKLENPSGMKNFNSLNAGDRFIARIVDIKPNKVTLQFESGTSLTARFLVLPEYPERG